MQLQQHQFVMMSMRTVFARSDHELQLEAANTLHAGGLTFLDTTNERPTPEAEMQCNPIHPNHNAPAAFSIGWSSPLRASVISPGPSLQPPMDCPFTHIEGMLVRSVRCRSHPILCQTACLASGRGSHAGTMGWHSVSS